MAAIFQTFFFKCISLNENEWISPRISLKFVPKVRINNIPALVQIMAWRRLGDKPLSGPTMVSLLTYICVTRPQWVSNQRYFNEKICLSGKHDICWFLMTWHDLCQTTHKQWWLNLGHVYTCYAVRGDARSCRIDSFNVLPLHRAWQWRHNEGYGVSNYRRLDCLPKRLFRQR